MTTNNGWYENPFDEERRAADSAELRERLCQANRAQLWVQFCRLYAEQGYDPVAAADAADAVVAQYDARRCKPGKEVWGKTECD